MNREKRLFKNTLILLIGSVAPKIAALVTLPIYTLYLTKAEYGTYDLITILVSLFLPIVTLQIQTAAFRFLIDVKNNETGQKTIITNTLVFLIPCSTVSLIILYFSLYKINPYIRILICIYFFIDTFVNVIGQITRGFQKNKAYSFSSLINALLNVILVIFFIKVLNWGLEGLLISLSIAIFISCLFLIGSINVFRYIDLKLINKNVLKELISYSWPMIPNSLSMWIVRVSDRLVLSFFIGFEANAIYAVANKIPNLFSMFQSTFNLSWQESASTAVNDSDAEVYYSNMFDHIYNLYVGSMALLIASTPVIFSFLIKGDYRESYFHMPILFMGTFFYGISAFLGGIFVAYKKTKNVGVTTICAAILNLIMNVIFIKKYQIYAVSVSTTLSYLFLTVFRMVKLQKLQNIRYDWRKITITLLLLVSMCFMCFMRKWHFNIINFLLGGIIFIYYNHVIVNKFILSFLKKIHKHRRTKSI